jgi:hypothetical protein
MTENEKKARKQRFRCLLSSPVWADLEEQFDSRISELQNSLERVSIGFESTQVIRGQLKGLRDLRSTIINFASEKEN